MSAEGINQVRQRAMSDPSFLRWLKTEPLAALAAFDLDERERAWFVLPNFRWLEEGRVAGCGWPGSADALARLSGLGIRAVISLTEEPVPADALARHGLSGTHLPLADFTAPDIEHITRTMAAVDAYLERGQPVALHCAGGLGRTGTLLACRLVHTGTPPAEAVAAVRAAQPGAIETAEQEAAIEAYAGYIRCGKEEREGRK